MEESEQRELLAWVNDKAGKLWPGTMIERIVALKGDASERRFWRAALQPATAGRPASAVIVDLGPEDLPRYVRALRMLPEGAPEPPYLNLHRFLQGIGAPVPRIYYASPGCRRLLVEDAGDRSLARAAAERTAEAADLYRLAIDELLRLHVEGTARLGPQCIASRLAYDERLFRFELAEFEQYAASRLWPGAGLQAIAPELDALAKRLGSLPRVFSHRDYHGYNLFLKPGDGLTILDFQDALLAPRSQDLAVLLTTRDAAAVIEPALEARLLYYYLAGLARRGFELSSVEEFFDSYRLCVIQHALKAIGRFLWLEAQGRGAYRRFVPYAVAQARRALDGRCDLPGLGRLLDRPPRLDVGA